MDRLATAAVEGALRAVEAVTSAVAVEAADTSAEVAAGMLVAVVEVVTPQVAEGATAEDTAKQVELVS